MGRPFRLLPRAHAAAFLTAFLVLNAAGWGVGWLLVGQRTARAAGPAAEPVHIAAVLPTLDVATTDRLVLAFADQIIPPPADGEALPSLDAAPFTIQPAVDGHWEWESTSRLAFLPDAPLGPCRRIVMQPTAEFERIAGRPVPASTVAIYETEPLDVTQVRVGACDARTVTVELHFNGDVTEQSLRGRLSIRVPDAETLSAQFLTRGASRIQRVQVERPAGAELVVRVARGLAPALGERGLEGDHEQTIEIPVRFSIVNTSGRIFPGRDGGALRINFSAALAAGQESLPITVSPDVPDLTSRTSGRRIILEGSFAPQTTYLVTVAGSVMSARGESLRDDLRVEIETPKRSPSLVIPHSNGTLSPAGNLTLSVITGGISAVRVTAHEVLPGNIVELARGAQTSHTSRRVVSEVFTLPPTEGDEPTALHVLDLAALFADATGGLRGVYTLHVADTASRWMYDTATLRITDLAPTAKTDRDGVHVWVRTLSTGENVSGARVRVMTVTDQTLGGATTDADGHVYIEAPTGQPDGRPFLVLVENGDGLSADLAYLPLSGQRWSIPRKIARGRSAPRTADVFVYPERNLYRPGDAVHLTAIARSPGGLIHQRPVRFLIERPDGATVLDMTLTPDPAQGLVQFDLPTSSDARTGVWSVLARDPASGDTIGRCAFSVEAFLPARIELTASAELSETDGHATSAVLARSLAGTALDGFDATLAVRWTPRSPTYDAYALFSFVAVENERSVVLGDATMTLATMTLATGGSAQCELPGQDDLTPGLWEARAEWTVTEPGSRSSVAVARVQRDMATQHLGLRIDREPGLDLAASEQGVAGATTLAAGGTLYALGLAVDPTGAPLDSGTLWFVLERVESRYELEHVGGHMRWVMRRTVQSVWSGPGEIEAGVARVEIECPSSGSFQLTLRADPANAAAPAPVRATFWTTERDPALFNPPDEDAELVTLTTSAQPAAPGETLTVHLRSPLDGTALVTLEDAQVRWHTQVAVLDGAADVDIPLPADVRGGVTVTCQVTRPLDASRASWTPHRAYGFLHIETSHVLSSVDVAIEAPERVRPGDSVTVTVSAALREGDGEGSARAAVHLWAVDEGIRLAGGHRLPNPRGHFFGTRAYDGVTTDAWFDLLPDLELAGVVSRIGGDGGLSGAARRRAPERVHTLPGVVWLEATELDENGRAQFEVKTPEFTGELTWMAVVVDGDRYGSASAPMRLAGEVPMLASFPRFVAPDDRFVVPLRFENQTDESVTVTPRLELTGPVRRLIAEPTLAHPIEASFGDASLDATGPVTLAPGERAVHWFEFEATGAGRITGFVRLEGVFESGREVRESVPVDVPVRSGRPLVIASTTRMFDAAAANAERLDVADLLGIDGDSDLADGVLNVSSHFGIGLMPAGRYLTEYPFGCAEQTASRIWALLAMPELASTDDDPEVVAAEVKARIDAGLAHLRRLQTTQGGIAYWSGQSTPQAWASAYVAELLPAALDLGFDVPGRLPDDLCGYLERELSSTTSIVARAALVRSLVALGRPQPGWTRRLAEQALQLGPGGRAQIASAFAAEGEIERALALLLDERPRPVVDRPRPAVDRPRPDVERPGRKVSPFERLISPTRTTALCLSTLLDIAPGHERVALLARSLEDARQTSGGRGRWNNTVDSAAALVALAKFHRTFEAQPSHWMARIQSGDGATFESDSEHEGIFLLDDPNAPLRVEIEGEGTLFLTVTLEGRVSADEPVRDAGLIVRRRWLDRHGDPLDMDAIAVGDLVFVEVTLASQAGSIVTDVAIVEPLPGGFEVENPRLSAADLFSYQGAPRAGRPDRVEFLDDRVLIFATAERTTRSYGYALRAVAAGTFEHGPIQAEAMYEPDVSSVGSLTTRVHVAR